MDYTLKMALTKAGPEEAVVAMLNEMAKKGVTSQLGKEIVLEVSEEIGSKVIMVHLIS